MIKYYYLIASLLAIYSAISSQGEVPLSVNDNDISASAMYVNVRNNPKPQYEFEKSWIAKAQELNKPKQPLIAPPKLEKSKPKTGLLIGTEHYTLIGVFTEPGSKFIVLKSDVNQLFRVEEGAAISPLATLVAVKTDNIEVKVGNEITIHKLFKRTQNDVNEKL